MIKHIKIQKKKKKLDRNSKMNSKRTTKTTETGQQKPRLHSIDTTLKRCLKLCVHFKNDSQRKYILIEFNVWEMV